MELVLTPLTGPSPDRRPVEIVERKGRGHPDTLCDALAEELCIALSRFYLDRFGHVLHHNVDKVLLWAGTSEPRLGGGEVMRPMEIFFAGRATAEVGGVKVPMEELVVETARRWLGESLHALDPRRHAVIHPLMRPGAKELVDLFRSRQSSGARLANDTSCGVGWAPLSTLERIVLGAERELTSRVFIDTHPQVGEDVKVMGVRRGEMVELTVASAVVDAFTPDLDSYLATRERVRGTALEVARRHTAGEVKVEVNCADDLAAERIYLTVTGTSAEAGDDGQTGRGNRVGGLITPYRPMVMEAAAGKNPVSHVGKLYSAVAHRLAGALVERLPEVEEAHCLLVSRIGHPVERPWLLDVGLRTAGGVPAEELRPRVEEVAHGELGRLDDLQRELLERAVRLF